MHISAVTRVSLTPVRYKTNDQKVSVGCFMQIFAFACWLLGNCNCQCAEISWWRTNLFFFFPSDLTLLFYYAICYNARSQRNETVVLWQNYVKTTVKVYRVIQEERSAFWNVTGSVIVRTYVPANICLILNGHRVDLFASANAKSLWRAIKKNELLLIIS